jgi:hypothetical protein
MKGVASMQDRVYQCSDGHLFVVRSALKLVFMSVHFGYSKYLRCPVDQHWRMATPAARATLTEQEIDAARIYVY